MRMNARASAGAAKPSPRRAHFGGVASAQEAFTRDGDAASAVIAPAWTRPANDAGGEPPVGGLNKRLFDIVLAGGALILLAPLLLAVAIAVRLDTGDTAIFRQSRGGFGQRPFRIWKFRTMRVSENDVVVQARENDPRVTPLGAFLRASSWDELPQLVNVLIGDMSLIGPRPHALDHDRKFTVIAPFYPLRARARPGITGLAQVSGCRGPTETDEKVINRTRHDVAYVANWSFTLDMIIIWRTLKLLAKWRSDKQAL